MEQGWLFLFAIYIREKFAINDYFGSETDAEKGFLKRAGEIKHEITNDVLEHTTRNSCKLIQVMVFQ